MTKEQLVAAVGCSPDRAALWAPYITAAMGCFDISSPTRQAAFLAQVGHESGGFSVLEENLNYSEKGLLAIFGKHFDAAQAKAYSRQPEKIANRAYCSRMGNSDEASGDGWRYRGRGLIQLTGKDSYAACGRALGLDLVGKPELLLQPQPASMSAGWEWSTKGCNVPADAGDFVKVTRLINGGVNGLEERQARWTKAKAALGVG